MTCSVYEVRRRELSATADGIVINEYLQSVDEVDGLRDVIAGDPNLHEVRPREILQVTVNTDFLSVEEVSRLLVVVESTIPDDMPIGLHHEVLHHLLGDEADQLCFYEDEWSRTEGPILRRALFINGRTFIPIRDNLSSELHLVECESVADYEAPIPRFSVLASIGFTEENSMVSGYDGEEVGLISEDVAIWYTRCDEGPNEVRVFRQEPGMHANMVLELLSSQFRPFMSKVMVEGLIGYIPEAFGDEIPEVWVEDEGSWSAITSLYLSPLLTSESQRSPIRQQILDQLSDSRRKESFEEWLAEYIESVVDSESNLYEPRISRQARIEAALEEFQE